MISYSLPPPGREFVLIGDGRRDQATRGCRVDPRPSACTALGVLAHPRTPQLGACREAALLVAGGNPSR